MNRTEIEKIMESVFTSVEAAEYLGISTQRLNKMVHDGLLSPIKSNKSTLLFYKGDLDQRKSIDMASARNDSTNKFDINNSFVEEAIIYFSVQFFMKGSDKKTSEFFRKLVLNSRENSVNILSSEIIAEELNVDLNAFLDVYNGVKKSFSELPADTVLINKYDERYSRLLLETAEAPPYLFARGNIDLLNEKAVSVVGSRNASFEGLKNTEKFVSSLLRRNIVVVAGLAKGIDTQAHCTTLENGSKTIAVIGTAINQYYPKENRMLQDEIVRNGLVISQFSPYAKTERWHFPVRNATMSGISIATVIMEAGETSGALIQADYALKQNRMVLIPKKAVDNPNIKWPKKYIDRGAKEFETLNDALDYLRGSDELKSVLDTYEEIKGVQMD